MPELSDLTLEQKLNVAWALAGIGVAVLIGYATIRTLKTHRKLEKRMGLDDDG